MKNNTFNEEQALTWARNYIISTYTQHYSKNKIQTTEFIFDSGHGEGFCMGNIIKYAQRYGKKAGKNRKDLLKAIHYVILLMSSEDKDDMATNTGDVDSFNGA